ncbi:MAG TPA: TIGR04255 family protein [Flavobacterium sp.]|nr:TIGR04255 family protein [Flavobacterium sp.]
MPYPILDNTPIKEIIFSISYEEIVDKDCFDNFVNLEFIKNKFEDIKPSVTNSFEITNGGLKHSHDNSGFHLKNKNEVLQMRMGSISYHFLNNYCEFDTILNSLIKYWTAFDEVTKDRLTISEISVRYINVIEIDENNPASHLVQLYPKQSDDRKILNFQNLVNFTYLKYPDYNVNVVSTKPKEELVLLDIGVKYKFQEKDDLKEKFKPLQEIKNKAFFDSITAKALIKYMKLNN